MNEYENFKKMCAARVTRAEQILNKWVSDPRIDMDQSAKEWLICALDPFHDKEIPNLRGWPDVSTAGSCVQTVTNQIQISATSGGAPEPTSNWDCHIAVVPDLFAKKMVTSSNRRSNAMTWNTAAAESAPFGGLMARSSAPNANVDWMPPEGSTTVLGNISLGPEFQNGLTRVIGIGFEVYDTTANINKQGSLLSYRQSEPVQDPTFWNCKSTGTTAQALIESSFTGTPLRLPPKNVNEAQFMGAKTITRNAFKGTYEVGAFHSNQNPPQPVGYNQPVWMPGDTEDTLGQGINTNAQQVWWPTPQSGIPINITPPGGVLTTNTLQWYPGCKLIPIHQFGCIISGLNPKATLTVVTKIYVERFANQAEKQIAIMCRQSASYKSDALEIYSHAVGSMPVGVPVEDNGLGEWFSDVIKDIEPIITPILSTIHPLAGMASKAVGSMNTAYRAQNTQAPGPGTLINASAPKRKKAKKKNAALAAGNRGKKGRIQGPMLPPGR